MDNLLPIITNTPLWVWPLLAALLWLGWLAGQTRVMSVRRMVILPIAIFAMSFATLMASRPDLSSVIVWAIGLAVGVGLGWSSYRDVGVAADREHRLVRLPGEWKTLGLIVIIFAFRYYWGYKSATEPELVSIDGVLLSYLGFNGMLSGIFTGWRLQCFQLYRTKPSENLAAASID